MSELLRAFNFEIELRRSAVLRAGEFGTGGAGASGGPGELLGTGGFQSCSGLQIGLDISDLQEGGRNDGVIRRVGRATYQPLTLERGMLLANGGSPGLDRSLWRWLQSIATGTVPVPRYDGAIRVLERGEVMATWSFVRGLPSSVRGPTLDAVTGNIALEELTIAHEGLRLEDA